MTDRYKDLHNSLAIFAAIRRALVLREQLVRIFSSSRIGSIEYARSKSCVRLYFYATAGKEDIVAAKIVVPTSTIPGLIATLRAWRPRRK
jgi:hypothetical protein